MGNHMGWKWSTLEPMWVRMGAEWYGVGTHTDKPNPHATLYQGSR